ncbi:3-keto-5-aminohexanoate cleavage protein [Dactylosporangium vinaceum]|uniref:3-keto-5-aminohexanoate cleavage protein n=1 Tax=Dactylosporangium vinaceum TaxID=53362 RepID=A0ABV5MFI4_9ACTN|nr:3-keto-5-aminohexanoate cleavage protein [Dactylosporangium vinaceum]UAC01626.1 3-keto-5-aminohexanoate cleavage protein [Dactylosporangium vinaceum]
MSPIARLKVALNGSRPAGAHPALPCTPDELGAAAQGAVAAGAEAVHLHARGEDTRESLEAQDIGAAVAAVRRTCPATPVGVSTGLWITGKDVTKRQEAVAGWAGLSRYQRPDFASVNVSEPGFTELAATLQELDIAVEAGVWTLGDADALSIAGGVPRVLVEIMRAGDDPEAILRRLDEFGVAGERLLHGEGEHCWDLVALAGRLGLPTRIGLEDTLTGPDGEPVADNAELVRLALSVWSSARSIA